MPTADQIVVELVAKVDKAQRDIERTNATADGRGKWTFNRNREIA